MGRTFLGTFTDFANWAAAVEFAEWRPPADQVGVCKTVPVMNEQLKLLYGSASTTGVGRGLQNRWAVR